MQIGVIGLGRMGGNIARGPNTGMFMQITCNDPHDIDVPGHGHSFGVAKAAQARGDLEVLVERGGRALRIHLEQVDEDLADLTRAIDVGARLASPWQGET
jgi:hypothetical protein